MPELKTRLERVFDHVEPKRTTLESLTRRRTRRVRARRLGAGFVAIVVAGAGIVVANRAFNGQEIRSGGPSASPGTYLWPVTTLSAAADLQAELDVGSGPSFLLDEARTAEEFARRVLGYPHAQATPCVGECLGGPERVEIIRDPDCIAACDPRTDRVVVDQPVLRGDRGLWVVSSVESSGYGIPRIEPGSILSSGDQVEFAVPLMADRLYAGFFVGGECGVRRDSVVQTMERSAFLQIDRATLESCSTDDLLEGHVYVADWPASHPEGAFPDPLAGIDLEGGPPVTGLAAVAVTFDLHPTFVPFELECESGLIGTLINEFGVGARGEPDPVAHTRKRFERSLRTDDVVERAGRVDDPDPEEFVVRIVRGNRVIAAAFYRSDGQGGWLNGTTTSCDDDL